MKNRFCRIALSGVLAAGLALCGAQAFAQDAPTGQGQGGGRGRGMDPDQMLARMTKRYNLSADQQSQIKPILVDRQQKMQALWQNQSLSREDRRSQMQAIHQDTDSRIEAVLNDQQKQKFQAMQERMHHGPPPQGGDNSSNPQPQ
jgi:hypothetical protein